jgi:hypothetical protein
MITLSQLPFSLSESIFRKQDLLKLPKTGFIIWLITLSHLGAPTVAKMLTTTFFENQKDE